MARVYQITEPEMNSLFDRLQLAELQRSENRSEKNLTPDENNRLAGVHRHFHYHCVRWAQEMGFDGYRK